MHRTDIGGVNIFETPIRPAPSPLMEVVQEHLGDYLDTGYTETNCPASGNDSCDYYGVRSR